MFPELRFTVYGFPFLERTVGKELLRLLYITSKRLCRRNSSLGQVSEAMACGIQSETADRTDHLLVGLSTF